MTLVSSVIDGEPSASLASYVDTFSVGRERHGSLFGGDIRLGSLGHGKGPEQT